MNQLIKDRRTILDKEFAAASAFKVLRVIETGQNVSAFLHEARCVHEGPSSTVIPRFPDNKDSGLTIRQYRVDDVMEWLAGLGYTIEVIDLKIEASIEAFERRLEDIEGTQGRQCNHINEHTSQLRELLDFFKDVKVGKATGRNKNIYPKYKMEARQILRGALPIEPEAVVYFLISRNEIVYVGQTINFNKRLREHQKTGKVFEHVYYIEVLMEEVGDVEAYYIDKFKPILNIQRNLQSGVKAVVRGSES